MCSADRLREDDLGNMIIVSTLGLIGTGLIGVVLIGTGLIGVILIGTGLIGVILIGVILIGVVSTNLSLKIALC